MFRSLSWWFLDFLSWWTGRLFVRIEFGDETSVFLFDCFTFQFQRVCNETGLGRPHFFYYFDALRHFETFDVSFSTNFVNIFNKLLVKFRFIGNILPIGLVEMFLNVILEKQKTIIFRWFVFRISLTVNCLGFGEMRRTVNSADDDAHKQQFSTIRNLLIAISTLASETYSPPRNLTRSFFRSMIFNVPSG